MAVNTLPWLLFVLIVLASYRMTRLVTSDTFPPVAAIRDAIERKFGSDHWVTYLTQCGWCAGWWITGLIVLSTNLFVDVPYPLLVWPAAAALVGMISQLEPDSE